MYCLSFPFFLLFNRPGPPDLSIRVFAGPSFEAASAVALLLLIVAAPLGCSSLLTCFFAWAMKGPVVGPPEKKGG